MQILRADPGQPISSQHAAPRPLRWLAAFLAAILIPLAIGSPIARAQEQQPTPEQIQGAAVLVDLDQRAIAGDTNAAQILIRVVFPDDQAWALRVARRESGFRCTARNPTSSASGLFQLLSIHAPRAGRLGYEWQDIRTSCLANLAVARALYDEQGHRPWQ